MFITYKHFGDFLFGMDIKDRKREQLDKLISHYSNGNKTNFAELIGISPQGLNNWFNRGSFDIELVYNKLESISADWLLSGEGNMLKGEEKLEFLESRNQGEFDLNQISFTKYRDKIIPIQVIPLYEFEATAGFLTQCDTPDAIYDYIRIPRMSKVDGASFVLGDSMTPTLKSGDIVVFKQYHDLQSILYGEMYLISILIEGDFHLVIKYIHRIEGVKDTVRLVSSNPTHQPIDVKLANIHAFAHIKASIRYHTML